MMFSAFHRSQPPHRAVHDRFADPEAQLPQPTSPARPATIAVARDRAVNHSHSPRDIEGQGRQTPELQNNHRQESRPRRLRRHVTYYEPGELVAIGIWVFFLILISALLRSAPPFRPVQTYDCPINSQTRHTCTQDTWAMILIQAICVGGIAYWLREHFVSNPLAKLPYRVQQAGIASTPVLIIFITGTISWVAGSGHGCFKGCA